MTEPCSWINLIWFYRAKIKFEIKPSPLPTPIGTKPLQLRQAEFGSQAPSSAIVGPDQCNRATFFEELHYWGILLLFRFIRSGHPWEPWPAQPLRQHMSALPNIICQKQDWIYVYDMHCDGVKGDMFEYVLRWAESHNAAPTTIKSTSATRRGSAMIKPVWTAYVPEWLGDSEIQYPGSTTTFGMNEKLSMSWPRSIFAGPNCKPKQCSWKREFSFLKFRAQVWMLFGTHHCVK